MYRFSWNYISDKFDTLLARLMVYRLKKGYGCDCETNDLDDFPEMYTKPKDVFASGRCGSCRAREVVQWLEEYIDLIDY